MTYLLKPNDNGLASLDEVKAWMEAQTSAQETPRKPERKRKNRSLEGFFLKQHAEAEHDYDGWQEALEGTDELIATLPEIYRGLKESRAFAEQLRKDLRHGPILTGTTCEVDETPLLLFNHRQEQSFQYARFDDYLNPFAEDEFFSKILDATDESPIQTAKILQMKIRPIAPRILAAPFGDTLSWYIGRKRFPVVITLENDEDKKNTIYVFADNLGGRIYTVKDKKDGIQP